MEVSVAYTDLKDRAIKVKVQEAKGLVMLHDNFDTTWKPDSEPHGTMIFTDVITPPVIPPDYKALWKQAATATDKIALLAKVLRLE